MQKFLDKIKTNQNAVAGVALLVSFMAGYTFTSSTAGDLAYRLMVHDAKQVVKVLNDNDKSIVIHSTTQRNAKQEVKSLDKNKTIVLHANNQIHLNKLKCKSGDKGYAFVLTNPKISEVITYNSCKDKDLHVGQILLTTK